MQEFKVTTSNPSPEEGRNSGANVSIATRSGTNQIHGTAFEFFRNTALNANEFYANAQGGSKPLIQLNQYGFELGGPIRKNKTFFFGSWQGQKVNFADPIDKTFGEPSISILQHRAERHLPLLRGRTRQLRSPSTGSASRRTRPLLVDPRTGALAAGVRNCASPTDANCVAASTSSPTTRCAAGSIRP